MKSAVHAPFFEDFAAGETWRRYFVTPGGGHAVEYREDDLNSAAANSNRPHAMPLRVSRPRAAHSRDGCRDTFTRWSELVSCHPKKFARGR